MNVEDGPDADIFRAAEASAAEVQDIAPVDNCPR